MSKGLKEVRKSDIQILEGLGFQIKEEPRTSPGDGRLLACLRKTKGVCVAGEEEG